MSISDREVRPELLAKPVYEAEFLCGSL
jgi:hypothetical protein